METTTLQTFALFESIIPTVNELFLGTPLADSPLLQFVALYLLLLWSASVIWVIKDITNRTENLLLQTICIFLPLFFTPVF
jgi:hypothetical protein